MEAEKMAKQMIDFHKATFDNAFNAMVMLQEQTEKMVNMTLEQVSWLPEEANKTVNEWVQAYKKGREDFKKAVDEHFVKAEDFFAGSKNVARAKAGKVTNA